MCTVRTVSDLLTFQAPGRCFTRRCLLATPPDQRKREFQKEIHCEWWKRSERNAEIVRRMLWLGAAITMETMWMNSWCFLGVVNLCFYYCNMCRVHQLSSTCWKPAETPDKSSGDGAVRHWMFTQTSIWVNKCVKIFNVFSFSFSNGWKSLMKGGRGVSHDSRDLSRDSNLVSCSSNLATHEIWLFFFLH